MWEHTMTPERAVEQARRAILDCLRGEITRPELAEEIRRLAVDARMDVSDLRQTAVESLSSDVR